MIFKLYLNKNINENASFYFDKAKKLKSKLSGVHRILNETKEKIKNLESKKDEYLKNREVSEKINIVKKEEKT
jgi:hypothetical protein